MAHASSLAGLLGGTTNILQQNAERNSDKVMLLMFVNLLPESRPKTVLALVGSLDQRI